MVPKAMLKELLPPVVVRIARRIVGQGIRFEGNYGTWQQARHASGGYDQEDIVRRIYEAECKVNAGEAADERDGVLFDTIQYSFPVMAALSRISSFRKGPLRVLDFGGAFAGVYRQYMAFGLPKDVSWNVVEQPEFVRLGRTFETSNLRFYASLEEVLSEGLPDVILLSSVMQYLENPHEMIDRIMSIGLAHIVIDRTPFSHAGHDLLSVQRVSKDIYPASYPCWIFSRSKLVQAIQKRYRVFASFNECEGPWRGPGVTFDLAGFMIDRVR